MKKRFWHSLGILLVMVMLAGLLSGCGDRDEDSLNNELAYRKIGIAKLQEGNYEEAVKAFESALGQSMAMVDELEVDICYYKAIAQYLKGDTDGAIATYTALIDFDDKNANAYYLRGSIYLAQGRQGEAATDYQSAVAYEKQNGEMYLKIGEKLLQAGADAQAAEILKQGLTVSGSEAADYRVKGCIHYLLGEYENARTYLDKAINGGDKEAVYDLARLEEALGNDTRAQTLYEQYIAENGENTEVLEMLGANKLAEGDYTQALAFFQQALATGQSGNEQALRCNEIAILEQLRDFSQAREKMEAYLEDYPADEGAAREYEFLKTR